MGQFIIEINEGETEAQRLGRMVKYLRLLTGMKREDFANYLHIPLGTVRDWEQGRGIIIYHKCVKELILFTKD